MSHSPIACRIDRYIRAPIQQAISSRRDMVEPEVATRLFALNRLISTSPLLLTSRRNAHAAKASLLASTKICNCAFGDLVLENLGILTSTKSGSSRVHFSSSEAIFSDKTSSQFNF